MGVDSLALQKLLTAQPAAGLEVRSVAAAEAEAPVAPLLPSNTADGRGRLIDGYAGFVAGPNESGGSAQPQPAAQPEPLGGFATRNLLVGLEQVIARLLIDRPIAAAGMLGRAAAGAEISEATVRVVERKYLRIDGDVEFSSRAGISAEAVLVKAGSAGQPARLESAEPARAGGVGPDANQPSIASHSEVRVLVQWHEGARPAVVDVRVEEREARPEQGQDAAAPSHRVCFEIDAGPMGRVGVIVVSIEGRLGVTLSAEGQAMAEALREHRDDLHRSLQAASVSLDRLSVCDGGTIAGATNDPPSVI